jgi:hypothetical protein
MKVASFRSDSWQKLIESEKKKWFAYQEKKGRKNSGGRLDSEWENDVWPEIVPKKMGEYILLDWEGIEDENGPVKYSVELATDLCDPQKYPRISSAIISAVIDVDNFMASRLKADVDEVKNVLPAKSITAKTNNG